MESTAPYPAEWETHVVLRDGSTAEIRPIRPSDREALVRFHGQQSQESIYFRYFRYRPTLSDAELEHFTVVDYQDRMAFVAMQGNELVAVARYEKWPERPVAEVAFFVHDDHHGKGLGTLMLEYLAAAGRQRGLDGFTASVLPENYRMLGVFRSAGFEVATRFEDGVIEVDLGIDVTAEATSAIADRQRSATARSVARLLQAKTVAVIGASRQPGTVGHELVRNLLAGDGRAEDGPGLSSLTVLAVNPNAEEVLGLVCHDTIVEAAASLRTGRDGPTGGGRTRGPEGAEVGGIDLAVIAVRAELVVEVIGQCAAAGVGGLLVISAGFAEAGGDGAARERAVVELARDNGMRLIGPAAFGLIDTGPPAPLRALYHPVAVTAGRVAVASQSGPLGAAVLERMQASGIGVSSFVGFGNRADVSVNDLLDHWGLDPSTDAVVLYVENVGNLRNFSTTARRTSLAKPIITIRPSSPDRVELLRQAGVILVDEVPQLVEQADLAANQPPARGNRVALISNSTSVARLAAAACRGQGLQPTVPSSVADVARDGSVLIGDLDSVSLRPSGEPGDYERVVVAAAVSDEVDLILLALTPTAYLRRGDLAELLDRVNRAIDKPVVAVGLVDDDALAVDGLPVFAFPEGAARALGRHARYGQWRAAWSERVARSSGEDGAGGDQGHDGDGHGDGDGNGDGEGRDGADRAELESVIDRLLAGQRETTLTMAGADLATLVEAIDLPVAPWIVASGADEAADAADRLGYPVVLKAANLTPRSVGERGGTAIDLHDRSAIEAAHERMSDQFGMAMRTTIVQRMLPTGPLLRLDVQRDRAFGAMVSIGPGGSALRDQPPTARRFLPFERSEAEAMVRAAGRAGLSAAGPGSEPAVVELIEALARAAAASERIGRITLNPILIDDDRAVAVDVEIVLRRFDVDPLLGLRHI